MWRVTGEGGLLRGGASGGERLAEVAEGLVSPVRGSMAAFTSTLTSVVREGGEQGPNCLGDSSLSDWSSPVLAGELGGLRSFFLEIVSDISNANLYKYGYK